MPPPGPLLESSAVADVVEKGGRCPRFARVGKDPVPSAEEFFADFELRESITAHLPIAFVRYHSVEVGVGPAVHPCVWIPMSRPTPGFTIPVAYRGGAASWDDATSLARRCVPSMRSRSSEAPPYDALRCARVEAGLNQVQADMKQVQAELKTDRTALHRSMHKQTSAMK